MTAEPLAISSHAARKAFRQMAADAKANCLLSRLLKAEIFMNVALKN